LCCHPPPQPHTLCLLQIKTYVIDNTTVTGVHTVDLTLAELKQVRVRERTFERSQAYNDFLPVMTFEECATMARVRAGVSPSSALRCLPKLQHVGSDATHLATLMPEHPQCALLNLLCLKSCMKCHLLARVPAHTSWY
jgi:hypothetical protein